MVNAIEADEDHIHSEVLALSMVRDSTMTIDESDIGLAVKLTKAL